MAESIPAVKAHNSKPQAEPSAQQALTSRSEQPTDPRYIALEKALADLQQPKVHPSTKADTRASISGLFKGQNPLALGSDQVIAIKKSFESLSSQRVALESKIAQVDRISPTQCIITVPEYGEEGKALLDQFATEVKLRLGSQQAEKFLSAYESSIRYLNKGLGQFDQKILIDRLEQGHGYQIVHEFSQSTGPDPRQHVTETATLEVKSGDLASYSQFKDLLP